MTLTAQTIRLLSKIACSEFVEGVEYRRRKDLDALYEQISEPTSQKIDAILSRKDSVEKFIRLMPEDALESLVNELLDPRTFIDNVNGHREAEVALKSSLEHDGLTLEKDGLKYRVRKKASGAVTAIDLSDLLNDTSYIEDCIRKCEQKIIDGDYSGAITNARGLLEEVLSLIIASLSCNSVDHSGDIVKMSKSAMSLLNMDPSQTTLSNSIRQIISGLNSIVSGLASLRNSASDAHARKYTAREHHAYLAINSAHTAARFFIDTYRYQMSTGRIKSSTDASSAK